jgi:hypothetical protein
MYSIIAWHISWVKTTYCYQPGHSNGMSHTLHYVNKIYPQGLVGFLIWTDIGSLIHPKCHRTHNLFLGTAALKLNTICAKNIHSSWNRSPGVWWKLTKNLQQITEQSQFNLSWYCGTGNAMETQPAIIHHSERWGLHPENPRNPKLSSHPKMLLFSYKGASLVTIKPPAII